MKTNTTHDVYDAYDMLVAEDKYGRTYQYASDIAALAGCTVAEVDAAMSARGRRWVSEHPHGAPSRIWDRA